MFPQSLNSTTIHNQTEFRCSDHCVEDIYQLKKFLKKKKNFGNFLGPLESLQTILNTKLNELSWNQASLPVSFGGIGGRKSQDLALPAFISSVYGAQENVKNLLPN